MTATRTSVAEKAERMAMESANLEDLVYKSGRPYFRDGSCPYPLPCDMAEIHRQLLRSMVLTQVFGGPFCAPYLRHSRPRRVLEVACGAAVWSSMCHDYYGPEPAITFKGLDILSQAPDLQQAGLEWEFVQHDLRAPRLPFPDDHFDLVFVKDTGLCHLASTLQAESLSEYIRVLKSQGTLEIWDSDYIIRTLLPNPPPVPGLSVSHLEQAKQSATYHISPATPFAAAQNPFLKDFNAWASKAFEERGLTGVPCAFLGLAFSTEADSFRDYGNQRIAIPFSELKWEQHHGQRADSARYDIEPNRVSSPRILSPDQLALRRTTLSTMIQLIDSLEPILIEASGKTKDEWSHWWAAMITDLLQDDGTASGECLEVGAWWGQKK